MRDYFAYTSSIRHAVENFVENTVSPRLLQTVISQLTTHRFEEAFPGRFGVDQRDTKRAQWSYWATSRRSCG